MSHNPLPRPTKPLKRTWITNRKRERKESAPWRAPRVREDAGGMAKLRAAAFQRSGGICECSREECKKLPERMRRITWTDSQLHHVISRARGGSDVLENLQLIRHACHAAIHGGLKWGERGRA